MAKSPPKLHESQTNPRASIHRHLKFNRPKKLQQQSSRRTEATKVNSDMDQLYESDGNGHRSKNDINNFAPLYESDD